MFVDRSVNLDMPAMREFTDPPAKVMKTREKCPICQNENINEFFTDLDVKRPTTYWNFCTECGHVFLNPTPSKKWLESYYKAGYRKDTDGNEDPNSIPARAVQNEAGRGMRQAITIMRFTNTIQRILDIGSSSGVGIAAMFDRYKIKKAIGVEPNDCYRKFAETMSQNAPELPGKVMFVENLSQVPKSPKFNFIHNSHVLEHMYDPVRELKRESQYLLAKGLMYIEVPYVFGGMVNPLLFPHLHAFTDWSLRRCIEEAGLYVWHTEFVAAGAGPLWPSPRQIFCIAKKKPFEITFDNMIERHNMYRFHQAYVRQQIDAQKNPMAKFG